MRTCFSSYLYDYHQHANRMLDLFRFGIYRPHRDENNAKVWFSQRLFCRAWPVKALHFFLKRFPDTFREMPSIQVMRWLDLVQPIFEEGVCSPTSRAVLISCYSFNIGTVFTEKFGHSLPSPGNPAPICMLLGEVSLAALPWTTTVVICSRCIIP